MEGVNSMLAQTVRARSAILTLAVGVLVFAAAASATTTPPGQPYQVSVELTDRGVIMGYSELPRGLKAEFDIANVGKKPHIFKIFNQSTRKLKPGGRAVLSILLLHRGNFAWDDPLNKRKPTFRGVFTVF
jgi:hypothetical protein